ncbi:MAG: hypothetical protein ACE5GK_05210 [Nitrospiria bacterium]
MKEPFHHLCLSMTMLGVLIGGCATYRPGNVNDLCDIFRGELDWYEAARDANQKWGTPIWVMMAIIHQESRFKNNAKPPRPWFLFIPLPRRSSAFGYAQAQDPAWADYIQASGNGGADRDNFGDAIDFVGWYTHATQRMLGISKWDAYGQYLAYHEGRGGYRDGAWKEKAWLKQVAHKVKRRSAGYNAQLKRCKAELDDAVDSWLF